MRGLITKDLQWKVLALILGTLLWFACINITNPIDTAKATVMLEIVGLEELTAENKILLNESSLRSTMVTVEVRGTSSELTNLKSKLTAYVDLADFKLMSPSQEGTPLSTYVTVVENGNYDFLIISPPVKAEVIIDRIRTAYKEVSVNFTGSVAEGYRYSNAVVEPLSVQISGPSSQIVQVSSVSLTVDLANRKETFTHQGRLKAYDINNKEIDVEFSQSEAVVTVPISKVAKIPVLSPSASGAPAEGFRVVSVTQSIAAIEVIGPEADVNALPSITLEPVNIDGKDTTVSAVFDLRDILKNTKLHIINGTPYECEVVVTIEPLVTKRIEIPIDNVEKKGYTSKAEILTEVIEVEVEGLARDIDALTSLEATINLSGLKAGMNEVSVEITPVNGIEIKSATESVEVMVNNSAGAEQPEDGGNDIMPEESDD